MDPPTFADGARADGVQAPAAGHPVRLKDIFVTRALDADGEPTEGLPTTAGSQILAGYRSPYASDAEDRMAAAGAVLLGKTNCDEFAMGSSNENSAYGPVRNPWDETLVPGGSSGGSAVAVAAGQAFFATGTDTGGSIRQPAALSGVVGMKPTYGTGEPIRDGGLCLVARLRGPVRPLGADVAPSSSGRWRGTIRGTRRRVDEPVPDYVAALDGEVQGLRLGVPREFFVPGMEPGSKPPSGPRSTSWPEPGRTSSTSRCPPPTRASRPTTSSPRPRPARTWPATTGSGTALRPAWMTYSRITA